MPPEFLDEYYMNQCEYNKRSFGGEVVRRIIG
jgi:5'-3' exoribonuclease 2